MSPRLRRLTRGARCGRSAYLGCLRCLWSSRKEVVPGESTCCWARMSDKVMEKKIGTRRAKEGEDELAAERRFVEVRRFMVSGVRSTRGGHAESERGQKSISGAAGG